MPHRNAIDVPHEERYDVLVQMHKNTQTKLDLLGTKLEGVEKLLTFITEPPPIQSNKKFGEYVGNYKTDLESIKKSKGRKKGTVIAFWVILFILITSIIIALSNLTYSDFKGL